jgi:hypothetical protein
MRSGIPFMMVMMMIMITRFLPLQIVLCHQLMHPSRLLFRGQRELLNLLQLFAEHRHAVVLGENSISRGGHVGGGLWLWNDNKVAGGEGCAGVFAGTSETSKGRTNGHDRVLPPLLDPHGGDFYFWVWFIGGEVLVPGDGGRG